MPDYLNIAPNSQTSVTPSTITVTIDGKNYDIKFKKYANGSATDDAYNIVRNHIYRYTITAVNTAVDVPLTLEYMVMDWNTVTNPNLTFGNPYGNANGESVPDEEPQYPSQGENTQNGSGNVTQ